MKRLLRGVIDFGNQTQDLLASNFRRLKGSSIKWVQPADHRIHKFVSDFFESELELPSARVLADYFTRIEDHEVIERLKDLKETPFYEGSNYSFILKELVEDQNRVTFMTLLKEGQEVARKGLVVEEGREKKRLQGVEDAIGYLQERFIDLMEADANARTRGEIRESAMEAKEDYVLAKTNPGAAWGCLTGIQAIDDVCHGLKRGEMWVHAAFVGEMKTTFALCWAYNLVTRYKRNVFYVSLEMPYKQVRNIICCLHSSHPRFALQGKKPLDYRKIRDGELSSEEEEFYFEVLDDFFGNDEEYCRFEIWCPDRDVTIADIKIETELLHKQMEVGMLVIDHGGLVTPDKTKRGRGTTEELNAVARAAKMLALHFAHGEGVPVLFLFQLNRQGKDDAEKNNGLYKLKALAYANEVERSADYVTTTYLDDALREEGRTKFGCLKNRDNPHFAPFEAGVDFTCRRIYNLDLGAESTEEVDADEMSAILNEV